MSLSRGLQAATIVNKEKLTEWPDHMAMRLSIPDFLFSIKISVVTELMEE